MSGFVYDLNSSRFTAKDPLGFKGGDFNLYRFAGGDPINDRDPSGKTFGGALLGAAGGLATVAVLGAYIPATVPIIAILTATPLRVIGVAVTGAIVGELFTSNSASPAYAPVSSTDPLAPYVNSNSCPLSSNNSDGLSSASSNGSEDTSNPLDTFYNGSSSGSTAGAMSSAGDPSQ